MAYDYREIKKYLDAGMTNDQIASHISNRTAGPIPCSEAKVVLEESGLVVEDPVTLARTGTLIDRYTAMPDNDLKKLLGWFISHVFGRGEQISSHQNPRAVQLAMVIAGLPVGMQPVAQQLLALGGGQPDPSTTAADIQAVVDANTISEAEDTRQDDIRQWVAIHLENNYINPAISDGVSSSGDLAAAIKAGL